eukprot:1513989-Amphidinium_carterae.1
MTDATCSEQSLDGAPCSRCSSDTFDRCGASTRRYAGFNAGGGPFACCAGGLRAMEGCSAAAGGSTRSGHTRSSSPLMRQFEGRRTMGLSGFVQ